MTDNSRYFPVETNNESIPEYLVEQIRALSGETDVRQIPGHPRYAITPNGQVWSVKPNAKTPDKWPDKPFMLKHNKGRKWITLFEKNKAEAFQVARSVLSIFVGKPPFEDAMPGFLDGDHYNFHVSNLRWVPRSIAMAENSGKLTHDQVCEIIDMYTSGMSVKEIAPRFGIKSSNVYHIISGRNWISTPYKRNGIDANQTNPLEKELRKLITTYGFVEVESMLNSLSEVTNAH